MCYFGNMPLLFFVHISHPLNKSLRASRFFIVDVSLLLWCIGVLTLFYLMSSLVREEAQDPGHLLVCLRNRNKVNGL